MASCPNPPAAYTGSNDTVAQLVAAQTDADQACQALSDRLDALSTGVTGLQAGVTGLDGDVQANGAQLHAIDRDVAALGTTGQPLAVTQTAGSGNGQDVQVTNWPADGAPAYVRLSSTDTSAENAAKDTAALHGDIWFALGLLCMVLFGVFFLRAVLP